MFPLPPVFNSSDQLTVCKTEIIHYKKIINYISSFPTGFTDNQYRWKPGVCGCTGVVPDRHVQPVPVWPTRCLLLHPAGKCPEHEAARRECPDRYSGGRSLYLPLCVACVKGLFWFFFFKLWV